MNKCIVGNLDCEYQFVSPSNSLPQKLRDRISASASLMRVFRGDLLWTLDEFDSRGAPDDEGPLEYRTQSYFHDPNLSVGPFRVTTKNISTGRISMPRQSLVQIHAEEIL